MPRVITDAYRDARFFIPYNGAKTEGVFSKPLTETTRQRLRNKAIKEAGGDAILAETIFVRNVLQECIVDWVGFYDVAGQAMPCTPEVIKEICECDPEIASDMVFRISNVARLGELEEQKN